MRLQPLWLGAYYLSLPVSRGDGALLQESSRLGSGSAFSSISISRNSSESKTSPQSWHSTYSVSSCRETTRTLGCLQTVAIGRSMGGKSTLPAKLYRQIPMFETISNELFIYLGCFRLWYEEIQVGLVIPTEMVVY